MKALKEAQDAASSISIDYSAESSLLDEDEFDEIKEEDYPNKRRYNAACALADEFICCIDEEIEQKEKECCQFIIDHADDITAANYLSDRGTFLYAQAIKDNFDLPISLPDEDEYREYELYQALRKIAKRNIDLSFEVWEWCLETFLPYEQYSDYASTELTSEVIDDLYLFPDNYRTELARYIDKHPDFMQKLLNEKAELASNLDALIVAALKEGLPDTAFTLFQGGLLQAGDDWKKINRLTDGTISLCKNHNELESAEYFKINMFPLVKAINIGMVQDEIDEWEKSLDDYISSMESNCKKYAYIRKNAWRKTVPDGSKYGLDPRNYNSEQEYIQALNEEKYSWREYYKNDDTLGLNLNDFETQEEYRKAYNDCLNEKRKKEREQWELERQQLIQEQREKFEEQQCIEAEKARTDDEIYTFCGVIFPHAIHIYYYRTNDPMVKVGDTVLVPVGDKVTTGKVVSVGQYMRIAAPYPVDKTKLIFCKVVKKV